MGLVRTFAIQRMAISQISFERTRLNLPKGVVRFLVMSAAAATSEVSPVQGIRHSESSPCLEVRLKRLDR